MRHPGRVFVGSGSLIVATALPMPVPSPQQACGRTDARSFSGWRAVAALPQRALMGLVKGYRLLLSPWLGNACRFEPTCSVYTLRALEQHGAAAGSYLGAARLLRCHPWCDGGVDDVPTQRPRLFTRWWAATAPTMDSCVSRTAGAKRHDIP
jgi:uncharacterized protein